MGSSPQPPEPAAAKSEEVNMAYGLDPRLFLENGPANQAAAAHARSSSDSYRAWAGLDFSRPDAQLPTNGLLRAGGGGT